MQPSTRFALAAVVGLVAAGAAYLAASGAVEPTLAGFVAGLNFLVWAGFVAQYVPVYSALGGAPGNPDGAAYGMAAKWGAIAGLAASIGVAGVAAVLFPLVADWYVAAVGLFTFGLTLWAMAVGMGVVLDRFDDENGAATDPESDAVDDGTATPSD